MHQFADDPPIEVQVGDRLQAAGETLATAESFTGGLIGCLVTEVPGASDYFDRSIVTYTHEAKMDELAVQREVLESLGAVNEIVAEQMARGVREVAGTEWAVATTGVAGPDTPDSRPPVGTGFIGIARLNPGGGSYTISTQHRFDGDRSEIKERGARQALRELHAQLDSSPDCAWIDG